MENIEYIFWGLSIIATLISILVGYQQYKLKKRIDGNPSVELVPDDIDGYVKLLNTGKLNLYVMGFEAKNEKNPSIVEETYQHPRLLSASSQTHLWEKIPQSIVQQNEVTIEIYYEDDKGRKWRSRHKGEEYDSEMRFYTLKMTRVNSI